jgi:lipopolysaccharide/colanic/teichoic acid biosynthesis glycosyltransferase
MPRRRLDAEDMVALVGPMRRVKRLFDVAVSAVALVALSPLLLALALAIRWKLGAPVLFTQTRPGLHGRPFTIYKFRTMLDARDAEGRPLPDEERLTRFGRFLRASSLDELPELLNVLKGEMSLVGPRPLIMAYLDRYTPEQARRMEVPPGVTGLAQVRGRNAVSWDERFRLDVRYVDEWSLGLDLWILLQTIRAVVLREGISAEGHATMPEFRGASREAAEPEADPSGADRSGADPSGADEAA